MTKISSSYVLCNVPLHDCSFNITWDDVFTRRFILNELFYLYLVFFRDFNLMGLEGMGGGGGGRYPFLVGTNFELALLKSM